MEPSVSTAAGEQPEREECWCCGTPTAPDDCVRLGGHPEVVICPRCARWLAKQAGEIEDRGCSGPAVIVRGQLRRARRTVLAHGWHRRGVIGPLLRRLGRYVP